MSRLALVVISSDVAGVLGPERLASDWRRASSRSWALHRLHYVVATALGQTLMNSVSADD